LVKHPLQNTENECHQCLSGSFRLHQLRCRLGLRHVCIPRWGSTTTANKAFSAAPYNV